MRIEDKETRRWGQEAIQRCGWPLLLSLLAILVEYAAAAGPRCPLNTSCQEKYNVTGDYYYLVEGKDLKVSYTQVKTFKLTCPLNVGLESASLPRFEELTSFELVILERCALPPRGLARALADLRVEPRSSLEINSPSGPFALAATHLVGLHVRALKIQMSGAVRDMPPVAEDFLSPLPLLTDLRLSRVRLPPAALLSLPGGLKSLWLTECALRELPRAVLARLPALQLLALQERRLTAPPDLLAAPALGTLVLNAPIVDTLVAGPALENATLQNMSLKSIGGNCSALTRLTVLGARALPATGWAACTRLRELRLSHSVLTAGALRGAAALTLLSATHVPAAPPRDLLQDAPALRELDLSANGLRNLPSGLFSASLQLRRLDLSGNALSASALAALEPFAALQQLTLSGNPLGDLCDSTADYVSNDMSPLRSLRALRSLRLQRAGVTRVCRDWRDAAALPLLRELDLRDNNVTELGYPEAAGASGALDLRGNPVRTVLYERDDYERALTAPTAPPPAAVLVDSELTCDCRVYWFARALRERPQHASAALAALQCAAPARPLRAVPLERLQCAVPQEQCAAGCACAVSGERSVLRCEGAALRALPLPTPLLPPPRAVYAARNNISHVPRDLPPELAVLDLSDNEVAELELETWSALLGAGRRVLLRGNPLRCGCRQSAALALLQAGIAIGSDHTARAERLDADNVTCADGRALLALVVAELCVAPRAAPLAVPLGALLGAALLLALTVLACLARPAARRWIKRFLVQHNLCLRLLLRPDREEGDGGERSYDAFVSFSHHDDKFVTEELVPHLEGAARPRRLCLHYRDWTPGEWIPTQIAESVRRSRRTLVVLSAHFLRSSWARAEFREAHAAALRDSRPRLVVLLLESPARLPLDPELRAFLSANTYLRRDDPRFWDKLLDALPAACPAPVLTSPCA